jgi:hypothetical protein
MLKAIPTTRSGGFTIRSLGLLHAGFKRPIPGDAAAEDRPCPVGIGETFCECFIRAGCWLEHAARSLHDRDSSGTGCCGRIPRLLAYSAFSPAALGSQPQTGVCGIHSGQAAAGNVRSLLRNSQWSFFHHQPPSGVHAFSITPPLIPGSISFAAFGPTPTFAHPVCQLNLLCPARIPTEGNADNEDSPPFVSFVAFCRSPSSSSTRLG